MSVTLRLARRGDLHEIVRMLADDTLGKSRERYTRPLADGYLAAFDAIEQDAHNEILVATGDDQLAGCLQITFIPNLTFEGRWRAQIEGVRVASDYRGRGVGRRLVSGAIERARARGCHLVQLTTNKARDDANAFYASLGFVASHVGFKLSLSSE